MAHTIYGFGPLAVEKIGAAPPFRTGPIARLSRNCRYEIAAEGAEMVVGRRGSVLVSPSLKRAARSSR
ncbi:MAG: hypothetical protein V3T28_00185 [Gemmatimonadales bacterium]